MRRPPSVEASISCCPFFWEVEACLDVTLLVPRVAGVGAYGVASTQGHPEIGRRVIARRSGRGARLTNGGVTVFLPDSRVE